MVVLPIRKLCDESYKEMLVKEHARGQQAHYTQVIRMKKVTIKLVNN